MKNLRYGQAKDEFYIGNNVFCSYEDKYAYLSGIVGECKYLIEHYVFDQSKATLVPEIRDWLTGRDFSTELRYHSGYIRFVREEDLSEFILTFSENV